MPHKFAAGQSVEYFAADGLPEDAGEYQYHIQRTGGGEQRCAREAQLRSAGPLIPQAAQQSIPPEHVGGSSRRVC